MEGPIAVSYAFFQDDKTLRGMLMNTYVFVVSRRPNLYATIWYNEWIDVDNLVKLTSDALQGVAYHDDAQIVRLYAEKHIRCIDPRTEVAVSKLASYESEYKNLYNLRTRK